MELFLTDERRECLLYIQIFKKPERSFMGLKQKTFRERLDRYESIGVKINCTGVHTTFRAKVAGYKIFFKCGRGLIRYFMNEIFNSAADGELHRRNFITDCT